MARNKYELRSGKVVRKIFSLTCIAIIFSLHSSFAQNWQWAKNYKNKYWGGYDIITDNAGNVYSVFMFYSTVIVGNYTFSAQGSNDVDMVLVKQSPTSQVVWAKHIGGIGAFEEGSVIVDNQSVYVYGSFGRDTTANVYFPTDTLFNRGKDDDIFIAKYDMDGNFKWAKSFGSITDENSGFIKYSSIDNTLVFSGNYTGTIQIGSSLYIPQGSTDGFMAKCDTAGNILWVRTVTGTFSQKAGEMGFDNSGNIYLTGTFFSNIISFQGSTPTTLNNLAGSNELYIAKYDLNGNIIYAKGGGGSGLILPTHVKVVGTGTMYIAGTYMNNPTFGSVTLPISPSKSSGFILKVSSTGSFLWGEAIYYSPNSIHLRDIETNSNEDLFIVGYFREMLYVDSVIIRAKYPSVSTGFVIKFNKDGDFEWFKRIMNDVNSTDYDNFINKICFDFTSNSLLITGGIRGKVSFGSSILNATTGTIVTDYDVFIAKLQDCTPPNPYTNVTGPTSFCEGDSTILITPTTGLGYIYQWVGNGMDIPNATTTSHSPKFTADYSVIVTDANGCSSVSPIIPIIIWPLPIADIYSTTNYGTACKIDSVKLFAESAFTYQWYLNNAPIFNANKSTYMATSSGKYFVVVSNNMGCVDTSASKTIVIGQVTQLTIPKDASICIGSSITLNVSGANSYNWILPYYLSSSTSSSPVASPLSSHTYTVIGTTNGCRDTAYITVTVLPLPPAPTAVFSGGVLTSSSTSNIQWNLSGNLIPGATYTPYIPTQSGWYTVTYTDINGCSATSASVYAVVGVEEYISGIDYSIYPNPLSDIVTISFVKTLRHAQLYLYNTISAKAILEKDINGDKITIQRGNLSDGIYFFRIVDENNKIAVGKLIVK